MITHKTTWTLKGPTNPVRDALCQSWQSLLLGLASGALLTLALLLAAGVLPGSPAAATEATSPPSRETPTPPGVPVPPGK